MKEDQQACTRAHGPFKVQRHTNLETKYLKKKNLKLVLAKLMLPKQLCEEIRAKTNDFVFILVNKLMTSIFSERKFFCV